MDVRNQKRAILDVEDSFAAAWEDNSSRKRTNARFPSHALFFFTCGFCSEERRIRVVLKSFKNKKHVLFLTRMERRVKNFE